MSKNNGGSAFPFDSYVISEEHDLNGNLIGREYRPGEDGMTLLDYLAAKAMHEAMSLGREEKVYICDHSDKHHWGNLHSYPELAKVAYDIAQAMVEEKQRREADE